MPRACRFTLPLILVLLPTIASAQIPNPGHCIVPPLVRVVTPRGAGVDSAAVYTVALRDVNDNPIPFQQVMLDFTNCDQVKFAAEQPFYPPSQMSCPSPPLQLVTETNVMGEARFIVLGSVLQRDSPWTGQGCVQVWAPQFNILLGYVSTAAYDQDGLNGLTANDLFQLYCDIVNFQGSFRYVTRSDLDGNGALDGLDAALWVDQYVQARGSSRTPERCDGQPTEVPQTSVSGAALRLAWNDCASGEGVQTRAFACNTNTGSRILEASFVAPPGVERMTGFEAEIWVTGNQGAQVPDWWHFETGGCRLTGGADFFPPSSCLPLDGSFSGGRGMDYLAGGAVGRIRVVGALADLQPGLPLLAEGQEYSLFRLVINFARTVGSGACDGCGAPVALVLKSLKLTRAPNASDPCLAVGPANVGDLVLLRDSSTREAVAFWQSEPVGWEVLDAPRVDVPDAIRLWSTNPFRDVARVELGVPRPMRCRLTLYDLAGRRRGVLLDEMLPAGTRVLTWNGRDDDGRPLASGYYVIRLATEEGTVSRPLIRLR